MFDLKCKSNLTLSSLSGTSNSARGVEILSGVRRWPPRYAPPLQTGGGDAGALPIRMRRASGREEDGGDQDQIQTDAKQGGRGDADGRRTTGGEPDSSNL